MSENRSAGADPPENDSSPSPKSLDSLDPDHRRSAKVVPDGGLQGERTAMAWHRTGVAMLAIAASVLLLAARTGSVTALIFAIFSATLATVFAVLTSGGRSGHVAGLVPDPRKMLRASGVVVAALSVAVTVVALVFAIQAMAFN